MALEHYLKYSRLLEEKASENQYWQNLKIAVTKLRLNLRHKNLRLLWQRQLLDQKSYVVKGIVVENEVVSINALGFGNAGELRR